MNNQVVTKSVINENLIRNTTYENVNGNYDVYGNIIIVNPVLNKFRLLMANASKKVDFSDINH